jgi:GNAT superfamily N-acetyltransferase
MELGLFRLEERHAEKAAKLLADSFAETVFFAFVFPEKETRAKVLPLIFKAKAGSYIAQGWAFATSEKLEGVMLVRSSQAHSSLRSAMHWLNLWQVITAAPLLKTWQRARPFRPIWQNSADFLKQEPAFIWLDMIAVDPALRGQGQMSRMMGPLLAYAKRQGIPCLLETEDPANVPIYEHFGFRVISTGHIELPPVDYF